MNNVAIIGQLNGEPEVVYNSQEGEKKLYKLLLKVPRKYAKEGQAAEDFINVKVWSNVLGDADEFYDQSFIGVEGRVSSFGNSEKTSYINEIVANKVIALG